MEVDKGSDQKSDILPHWMAAHACLKNEFTEDEKYHSLISTYFNHLTGAEYLDTCIAKKFQNMLGNQI